MPVVLQAAANAAVAAVSAMCLACQVVPPAARAQALILRPNHAHTPSGTPTLGIPARFLVPRSTSHTCLHPPGLASLWRSTRCRGIGICAGGVC